MRIVWDEPKYLANLAKHELDFEDLTPDFFLESVIANGRDGRLIAVGRLDGRVLAVIFKKLGTEGVSVISMRPASRQERRRLDA